MLHIPVKAILLYQPILITSTQFSPNTPPPMPTFQPIHSSLSPSLYSSVLSNQHSPALTLSLAPPTNSLYSHYSSPLPSIPSSPSPTSHQPSSISTQSPITFLYKSHSPSPILLFLSTILPILPSFTHSLLSISPLNSYSSSVSLSISTPLLAIL